MRKVRTAAFVSLDGVIQGPGNPDEDQTGGFAYSGWLPPLWDEEAGEAIGEAFSQPYDLLLGRKTYEIFAAYWPYQLETAEGEIARQFNAVTKYVATRSGAPLTWQNSVALQDAATDVARLKREDGPDLLTQGSANLIQTLLAHDLIDELSLLIFPVVLGRGKKLFSDAAAPRTLKLVSSETTPRGIIIARYQRGGGVETGTFATLEPSEAELARRERWRRGG